MTGLDPSLVRRVTDRLALTGTRPGTAAVLAALRVEETVLPAAAIVDLVAAVRADVVGAGPLEDLLAEPDVSDVLVNGPGEVWVDRGGPLPPLFAGQALLAGGSALCALSTGLAAFLAGRAVTGLNPRMAPGDSGKRD